MPETDVVPVTVSIKVEAVASDAVTGAIINAVPTVKEPLII